jgi:hypothetical protein
MPGGGKGGSTTSTVNVTNGPVTVDSDSTVEVKGLNDIKVAAHIDPIETRSRQEIVISEPIRTISDQTVKADTTSKSDITTSSAVNSDSKNALVVDLKPVVLDVCSTTTTKLPHGEILQPFNLHFGMTYFGVEMMGFNLSGEQRTIMRDLPKKPAVDWPAQQQHTAHPSTPGHSHSDHSHSDQRAVTSAGGLRVRIKPSH